MGQGFAPSITLLAQAPPKSLWIWLGVLIVACVIGGVIALAVRRRLLSASEPNKEIGLLDEARAMVEAGEMTQEEFNRMKQVMVARAAGKEPPPLDQMAMPGESRSKPGFDLTGEPLPKADPDNAGPASASDDAPNP